MKTIINPDDITIRTIWADPECHSLHSYFNICPESPDGKYVLIFVTKQAEGLNGDLWLLERATGDTKLLETGIEVEDAHRQANQQWVSNGKFIIYMILDDGVWKVVRLDPDTMIRIVLCENRQVCWGQPNLDIVPLYGPHWAPGNHRDQELLNVVTGEIETVLTAEEVCRQYADFLDELFSGKTDGLSLFFPILSPDGERVFLKPSVPEDGKFRSPNASIRNGMVIFDIKNKRLLGIRKGWGHPAWHPDSRHIQSKSFLIDTNTMQESIIPNYPEQFNSHSVISPDNKLLAMDIANGELAGKPGHWTIVLSDLQGNFQKLFTCTGEGHGTYCWRQAHPHPIFNAESNRLYFNVNEGQWTILYVAEFSRSQGAAKKHEPRSHGV